MADFGCHDLQVDCGPSARSVGARFSRIRGLATVRLLSLPSFAGATLYTLRPYEPSPRKTQTSVDRSSRQEYELHKADPIRPLDPGPQSQFPGADSRGLPAEAFQQCDIEVHFPKKTAASRLMLATFGEYFERGIPCRQNCWIQSKDKAIAARVL